jgi:hypothetical protein
MSDNIEAIRGPRNVLPDELRSRADAEDYDNPERHALLIDAAEQIEALLAALDADTDLAAVNRMQNRYESLIAKLSNERDALKAALKEADQAMQDANHPYAEAIIAGALR